MESTMQMNTLPANDRKCLSRNALKYIVIVAMLIDHIAELFESSIDPMVYQIMRCFGRLTGPTMAFFLAEGAKYTRDIAKYQKRLAIFAVISWFPYVFATTGPEKLMTSKGNLILQSVIYTLFLGITAIRIWDSKRYDKTSKIILTVGLCLISVIGDWPIMDVLAPLFMYLYKDDKKKRYISVGITYLIPMILVMILGGFAMMKELKIDASQISLQTKMSYIMKSSGFQMGIIMVPLIILLLYNGKGGKKNAFNKWFFYIFYPAHLLILGIIKWVVLA